jgi:ABC-type phosphate/phosphonate transport system permease subunit
LAGMLSIAFRPIGFIGKLFCEALEEAHPGPRSPPPSGRWRPAALGH